MACPFLDKKRRVWVCTVCLWGWRDLGLDKRGKRRVKPVFRPVPEPELWKCRQIWRSCPDYRFAKRL